MSEMVLKSIQAGNEVTAEGPSGGSRNLERQPLAHEAHSRIFGVATPTSGTSTLQRIHARNSERSEVLIRFEILVVVVQ